ncbi:MAG: efflux RND transporter periplasmic adaptor subunit [Bacteroidales bacterium]|nr:efflux RND transporter periplasmic adaptor subunit [Bacteroidales bacterium]
MKQILWTIAIGGLFMLLAPSCSNNNTTTGATVRKVKVAEVKRASQLLKADFPGRIVEAREVGLAFRVAGPIHAVYVKNGDFVQKGQLIAEIDTRDYQVQFDVANAQYTQVKAETDRVAELHKRKSISQADYEKAMAGEKLVSTQLRHATDQLNDTKLHAPFAGYIHEIGYEKGEMINTGMPFARLINTDFYEVEVDVPEPVFLNKDNFKSFSCSGIGNNKADYALNLVSSVRKADNNQLYRLVFRLNSTGIIGIMPGMAVNVSIFYADKSENPMSIPAEAVFNDKGSSYVWVVTTDSSLVSKREVIVEKLNGNGNVRIVSGLEENELVVVAGVHVLTDGQKVEVIAPVSETNIGGLL